MYPKNEELKKRMEKINEQLNTLFEEEKFLAKQVMILEVEKKVIEKIEELQKLI